MSASQKQIALIVLGLALLYWLWKRSASPATSAPATSAGNTAGAAGGAPGGSQAPAPSVAAKIPAPVDVAGAIPDGGADFMIQNGDLAGNTGWAQDCYEQLWFPASQIPLSNLTAQDYVYAQIFLQNQGGEFTRRDDLGQLGAALIASANANGGAEVFNQIAGSILSMIPIVGKGFSMVTAAQNQALAGSANWQSALGNGAIGSLLHDSLGQPTDETRHLLANYSDTNFDAGPVGNPTDGPEAPLDRRVMGMPVNVPFGPLQNISPWEAILQATTSNGAKPFRIRERHFTKFQGGWVLPWLSWHTNGDTTQHYGLKATVNARARVLRAVDVIVCQATPYAREGAPSGYWADVPKGSGFLSVWPRYMGAGQQTLDKSVYFYRNSIVGPMMGSIFPPTSEDVRYVGSDGRTYSYYGEPMNNPAGSIGFVDDLDVNPADAAKLAARTAAQAAAAAAAAAALAAYNKQVQAAEGAAAATDAAATAARYAGTLPCSVDDGSCAFWSSPPNGTPAKPGGAANQPGYVPPAKAGTWPAGTIFVSTGVFKTT